MLGSTSLDSLTCARGTAKLILETFAAETFDAIISDQPYGVDYRDFQNKGIEGDLDPETIANWSAPAMERVLKQNSFAVLHGVFKRLPDGRYVDMVWRQHLAAAGVPVVD